MQFLIILGFIGIIFIIIKNNKKSITKESKFVFSVSDKNCIYIFLYENSNISVYDFYIKLIRKFFDKGDIFKISGDKTFISDIDEYYREKNTEISKENNSDRVIMDNIDFIENELFDIIKVNTFSSVKFCKDNLDIRYKYEFEEKEICIKLKNNDLKEKVLNYANEISRSYNMKLCIGYKSNGDERIDNQYN